MTRFARRAPIAVVALAAGAWLAPRAFDLDDAYISLHSARVLVDGYDPAFHAPALLGATNPPYVALLAGLIRLGVPDLSALRVAAALSLASLVVALWSLGAAAMVPRLRRIAWLTLVLASGYTFLHATNGLETGFAMALVTAAIASVVANRPLVAAFFAGLLPALRPELGILAAILIADLLWKQPGRRAGVIGMAALGGGPWFLWLHAQTGAWLPVAIRAKAFFFAQSCISPADKAAMLGRGLATFAVVALPGTLGLLAAPRAAIGRIGLLAAALILVGFTLTLPSAMFFNGQRYLYPILLPWCALGWVEWSRRYSGPAATVALVTTAVWAVALGWSHTPERGEIARSFVGIADWANARTDPDAVLLVHDAGAISVFGRRRLVDMVGLKTRSSADAHRRWTYPSCGKDRSRAVAAIARAARADYLVVLDDWDALYGLSRGLRREGFDVQVAGRSQVPVWPYVAYRIRDVGAR